MCSYEEKVCIMNGIGINPNVAGVTPRVSFQGATRIVGKRPDVKETYKTLKNSKLGQFIMDKAGKAIKFVTDKIAEYGGFKGIVNTVKNFVKNIDKNGVVKKGIDFVTENFNKIANNETIKKVVSSVIDVFKKAPKTV